MLVYSRGIEWMNDSAAQLTVLCEQAIVADPAMHTDVE